MIRKLLQKLKARKACENCIHKDHCDELLARKYRQLGVKEPESFKNAGCKLFKPKRKEATP